MSSFYWTWIHLRIEISQLPLSDDLSPPQDVFSITKKRVRRRKQKCMQLPIKSLREMSLFCVRGSCSSVDNGQWILKYCREIFHSLVAEFKLSSSLIPCGCVHLWPVSIHPNLVHNLSLLFNCFQIKAPDTRSSLTWVILQPLTFPSLKQARACTLIDPADGLVANLPSDQHEVTVFHC